MKRKALTKLTAIALAATMLLPAQGFSMMGNVTALAATTKEGEGSQDAKDTLEIKGDYYYQYASTLYQEGKIKADSALSLSIDKTSKSLIFSGSKEDLTSKEIVIDKTFNFDGNTVSRFSFDALAGRDSNGKKTSVTLGFYLDGASTPFVTKKLYSQKKKNNWTYSKDCTIDISSLKLTGEHTLSIKVEDASQDQVEFSIKRFEFVESSVPVVYLNIDESDGTIAEMNASEDHSVECYGQMDINVPEGYTNEYVEEGQSLSSESYEMEYIRGRGNSTWTTDKKPYKIKLASKQNVLGMGKNKHWVLLANYYDNSLLRNKMTYWLGEQMGMEYTPASVPVEVVMNGEYLGSYYLCEQVRVGKTRVDIDDLDEKDGPTAVDGSTITGGYLLGLEPYEDEENTITTKHGANFELESPKFDTDTTSQEAKEAQTKYITNYLNSVEAAIYSKDYAKTSELMDMPSTALYYLVQEFSMNGDAYISSSTYVYKKRDGKLYWGPLWDFDYVAWGSTEYEQTATEGWTTQNHSWIEKLFDTKEFGTEVVKQWKEKLEPAIQELVKEGGQLDQLKKEMEITARYNFEKLGPSPLSYEDDLLDGQVTLTYDQEIERLRTWIKDRYSWVESHIETLSPKEVSLKFYANGKLVKTMTGYNGKTLDQLPTAPAKKGYVFSGWYYTAHLSYEEYLEYIGMTDKEFKESCADSDSLSFYDAVKEEGYSIDGYLDKYTTLMKNMKMTAEYVKASEVVYPNKVYFSRKHYYLPYYSEEMTLNCQVTPFEATDSTVTYSVDKKDLATVEDGILTFDGCGTVTVTATTQNGIKSTCKVTRLTEAQTEEVQEESQEEFTTDQFSMTTGQYKQIPITYYPEKGFYYDDNRYICTDYSVVEIGNAGVLHAVGPGTAYIIGVDNYGSVTFCKVVVSDKKTKSSTVTIQGLKYKITSDKASSREVKVVGATSKTKKTVTIPSKVKINKKTYKVTRVASKAFNGNKNLKKVALPSTIKTVGKYAFGHCTKLKNITIHAKKASINKKAFAGSYKKATYHVPKKSIKYYKKVLKTKRVK